VQVQVRVQPPPTITAVVSTPPPAPIPAPAAPASAGVVGTPARANCEKPPYPAAARRAGETGAVRLNVLVSTEGKILESKMQRSSGYRRLDDLATQGLRDCKPKPAIVDGRPQQSWVMVEFNFSMND
jgi:protein TonB